MLDALLSNNAARKRMQNSARGLNTLRAMNLAVDTNTDNTKAAYLKSIWNEIECQ